MTLPMSVVGNVNVDLVMGPQAPWPVPGTETTLARSELRVGGAAGNTALAWQGLGVPFHIAANTSTDVLGHWLREPFGSAAEGWPASPKPCGISVGLTHPDGERTFFTTLGHLEDLGFDHVLPQVTAASRPGGPTLLTGCFVTPRLLPRYADLIAALRRAGRSVAIDTGWPNEGWSEDIRSHVLSWLPGCDHLLINEAEALGLTATASVDAASAALAGHLRGDAVLVIKAGARGAFARHGRETIAVPAPPVSVIDTIGAGDAFNAGYLLGWADGRGWHDATAVGIATASQAIATSPRRYQSDLAS